jgi:methylphosphotriester-DNA--protein-cysteine methyltransferase
MDLFREISTHEEAALLEHLRDCERCREERKRLQLLMRLIQTAMELPPRVPLL